MKKRIVLIIIFVVTVLSGCGGIEFNNEPIELDYDNISYNTNTEVLIGERKNSVTSEIHKYVLTKNFEEMYSLDEFCDAGEYDGHRYMYHYIGNNIELVDENNNVCGVYAKPPKDLPIPTPEALLSGVDVLVAFDGWTFSYYNKYTGDEVYSGNADRCENFENGIAVIENRVGAEKTKKSNLEEKMNGDSETEYIKIDNFEPFMIEKNGVYSDASYEDYLGQDYMANGLYNASYCQGGILPYLETVVVAYNEETDTVTYDPQYSFYDRDLNKISDITFRNTTGFVHGCAFCTQTGNPALMMMNSIGEFYPTQASADSIDFKRVYYYPKYDCFGLTKIGGQKNIPELFIASDGHIIAYDEHNNAALFRKMLEYDVLQDYETLSVALELPFEYDDDCEPIFFEKGFLVGVPHESAFYFFNYSNKMYERFASDEYIKNFSIKKIDYRYASTDCGVFDTFTGLIVNKTLNAVAYDGTTDTVYVAITKNNKNGTKYSAGLGCYDKNGNLKKFNCSEAVYIGDGRFVLVRGWKCYRVDVF